MDEVKYLLREDGERDLRPAEMFRILLRNWLLMLIGSLLLPVAAFIWLSGQPDYYELSMRYYSNIAGKEEIGPMLDFLSDLVEQDNPEAFATLTGTDATVADAVKTIRRGEEEQNASAYVFELIVETTDPSTAVQLQEGVKHFLSSQRYLTDKMETRSETISELLERAEAARDELQQLWADVRGNKGKSAYPERAYIEAVEIEERILKIKEEKTLLAAAEPYLEVVEPKHPAGPRRSLVLAGSLLIGFVLTSLVVLFLQQLKDSPAQK